jgi:hypothetical protein
LISFGTLRGGIGMALELSDYLIAAVALVALAFWIDRWWRK